MHQLSVEQAADLLNHCDQWLAEHMPELEAQYPGKIVAIENDQVIAVGITYREIYDRFKIPEREWMPLIVEVPCPTDSAGGFLSLR
jgi:Family of unknown function (DUF5678)